MGKRFILAGLVALAAIAACVGSDPGTSSGSGGIGQPCVGDVCLAGLACVEGICRVAGSSAEGGTLGTDGGTNDAAIDGSDLDGANADAGDAGDGAPQCTQVVVGPNPCTSFGTDDGGVTWTNPADACGNSGAAASVLVQLAAGLHTSADLIVGGFGYDLPASATIESVSVSADVSTSPSTTAVTMAFAAHVGGGPVDTKTANVGSQTSTTVTRELKSPSFTPPNLGGLSIHVTASVDGDDVTASVANVRTSVTYCTP